MKKNSLSTFNKNIKAGDIFHAEHDSFYGKKRKHYFYCVYSQVEDINNFLEEDVIGLMITTNDKMAKVIEKNNDYNVKIKINNTTSYVCCDKFYRFNIKSKIGKKSNVLRKKEKEEIMFYYKKFINESLRQLEDINGKTK